MMMKKARMANQDLKVDLTLSLERPVDDHRTRRRVPVAEILLVKVHLRAESPSLVQMMMPLMTICMMMVHLKMRTMIKVLATCPASPL